MNGRLSKIRSVHTYGVRLIHVFARHCICSTKLFNDYVHVVIHKSLNNLGIFQSKWFLHFRFFFRIRYAQQNILKYVEKCAITRALAYNPRTGNFPAADSWSKEHTCNMQYMHAPCSWLSNLGFPYLRFFTKLHFLNVFLCQTFLMF